MPSKAFCVTIIMIVYYEKLSILAPYPCFWKFVYNVIWILKHRELRGRACLAFDSSSVSKPMNRFTP